MSNEHVLLMEQLHRTFELLLSNYTTDSSKVNAHWQEIARAYSDKYRFYHNLTHLENMLSQLMDVKNEIENWDAVLFALYYHDVIYDPSKATNEIESAQLAIERMHHLCVPEATITRCEKHILATQKHSSIGDVDTNYFLDADLSILGSEWKFYSGYTENIRKEYAIFPDSLYIPGRKKVVTHFLDLQTIFKTSYFQTKFEATAKRNLEKELLLLTT